MSTTSTSAVVEYRRPATPGPRSRVPVWLIQTFGIFYDAYRELNAKRLFWITLWLSLLVVASFAFVGINERGVTVFTWVIFPGWNSTLIPPDTLYNILFIQLAIPYWLGLGATILALVSVGAVFPDFLGGGSIDLYLSKPIGRLRLFLTKYLAGLLFVALQVLVFCVASFFVMGIRGGTWQWGIFLAVPLVVLFFSYLYCVCVLLGIVTRSALASILITLLFWFFLFMLNTADLGLMTSKAAAEERQARQVETIQFYQQAIDQQRARPTTQQVAGVIKNYEFQRDEVARLKQETDPTVTQLRFWYQLINRFKAPMPKTGETVALMSRWLVDPDPITRASRERYEQRRQWQMQRQRGPAYNDPRGTQRLQPEDPEVQQAIQEEMSARAATKIIGTSVGFECVVLGIAAWIFCRRDF
jgi:ABC-type transport system involved in multi-copper enzyme maturation permease subunit